MDFGSIFNDVILVTLGLSTVFQVLNWTGVLPKRVKGYLRINHADDTLAVMEEMGVDVALYKKWNIRAKLPLDYNSESIEKVAKEKLGKIKMDIKVSVGKQRNTEQDTYYDLIGYSCDHNFAESYAKLLSTYWARAIETGIIKENISFIVTPKGGSPILGYEFSKILKLPFVLHEAESRFSPDEDMRSHFDCAKVPAMGACALIVDDSTTGGRKVVNTIKDLKKYGYGVSHCLVVFAPQTKDAIIKLKKEGVDLLSITTTHEKKRKKGIEKKEENNKEK